MCAVMPAWQGTTAGTQLLHVTAVVAVKGSGNKTRCVLQRKLSFVAQAMLARCCRCSCWLALVHLSFSGVQAMSITHKTAAVANVAACKIGSYNWQPSAAVYDKHGNTHDMKAACNEFVRHATRAASCGPGTDCKLRW